MHKFLLIALVGLVAGVGLTGCSDQISTKDMEDVRSEMSQEAYEDAMRKAGRGDELEADKKAQERRNTDDAAGNF